MATEGGDNGTGNGTSNCTTVPNSLQDSVVSFQNLMMFLTITAIFGALVQGIAPKTLLKNVPQPIIILAFYLIAGVIFRLTRPAEVDLGIHTYVDPTAIQALFLPVLMFSELFRLNTRAFFIVLNQLLLLVGPGVVFGAVLTAIFPYAIMPSRPLFNFNLSMAFGGMLATTDPIAIIICVNELSAPKRLAALVGGESLLNDGTSIVLVSLFLQLRQGGQVNAGSIVFFAFNQLIFSVLFGTAMGILSVLFIRIVRNDSSTLITFVVSVPFLTYVVASYFFNSSGVLSIIPLGVILNDFGRGMMMEHVERIERLFDQLAFIATGWLYGLSGFVVGEVIASHAISAVDWGSLFILYIWINVVRFIMVFICYPVLKHTGYGFSVKEALLLAFGGLRGAVGLTLALFIKAEISDDPRSGALIEFFMAGTILLMIVNGVMTPFVLKRLKLNTVPNEHMMEALQQKMAEQCVDTLESAGVEYFLAQYLAFGTSQNEIRQSRRRMIKPVNLVSPTEDEVIDGIRYVQHAITKQKVALQVLIEQRKHLVRAQRQMYEHLLTRGLLNRGSWYLLDRAADAQLEKNHFHLDQFRFVVLQAFKSKRYLALTVLQSGFYTSTIAGRLLDFLRSYGMKDIDQLMVLHLREQAKPVETSARCFCCRRGKKKNDGEDKPPEEDVEHTGRSTSLRSSRRRRLHRRYGKSEDDAKDDDSEAWFPGIREISSRATGIAFSPDEWLYNFALASWGFILAQQDSIKLVDEMLTVSASVEAFPSEREALKMEIIQNCALPARFLDAIAKYHPSTLERIKRLHALSEAGNRLFGSVAQLNSHGLLERSELKRLLRFAEKGLKRIRNCDFELQMPTTVGDRATLLRENPNFFPFHRQYRVQQQAEQEVEAVSEDQAPQELPPPRTTTPQPPPVQRLSSIKIVSRKKSVPAVIKRRRSFSDFDEINRKLVDGSQVTWKEHRRASLLRSVSGGMLMGVPEGSSLVPDDTSPELIIDTIHPVDISRIMDVLKLDDSQLKRY